MAPKRSRANGKTAIRNLILVLGDQLDAESAAFDGFDGQHDAVWMAEVAGEATRVWSHRARIALFLSAMRHFRGTQRAQGRRILYQELTAKGGEPETFAKALATTLREHRPKRLIVAEPGEWGVKQTLHELAQAHDVPLEVRTDRHFLCTKEDFAAHAEGRKQLRMEFFYREMRRRNAVLMDEDKPVGGTWNFDAENRASFGKSGPGNIAEPVAFPPDRTTRDVLKLVEERFAKHPGSLAHFDWPVTRDQALAALKDFVAHRLPQFGQYQDAMWASSNVGSDRRDAYLCHSRLSVALNLKLLNPREVIAAAEQAHREGHAPLPAVEGFIRQILGWREYVRGVYWWRMPEYAELNALEADLPMPAFMWDADTEMNCVRQSVRQLVDHAYAHHIQRL
ncbi:MAG TPA: cryptochrome/photolyase family protein, partial [Verrucomicrobiales bacterium]|nr:cryptochrome/photolyase family protein [Verrucomicrobiales bacterium]